MKASIMFSAAMEGLLWLFGPAAASLIESQGLQEAGALLAKKRDCPECGEQFTLTEIDPHGVTHGANQQLHLKCPRCLQRITIPLDIQTTSGEHPVVNRMSKDIPGSRSARRRRDA
jgi:hypothetical protein